MIARTFLKGDIRRIGATSHSLSDVSLGFEQNYFHLNTTLLLFKTCIFPLWTLFLSAKGSTSKEHQCIIYFPKHRSSFGFHSPYVHSRLRASLIISFPFNKIQILNNTFKSFSNYRQLLLTVTLLFYQRKRIW